MRVKFYALLAGLSIMLGSLALTAGAASASVTDHNPGPGVSRFDPRPEPVRFISPRPERRQFFCTREDRRLEFWLLRQRHLNRFQRAELRFLERICDDDFFFGSFPFQR